MTSFTKTFGLLVGAGVLSGLAFPALAQLPGAGQGRGWGTAPYYGTPVQALPTPYSQGGSCVQWCVADASPCDPDYFKVADRRCNVNLNGYFPK